MITNNSLETSTLTIVKTTLTHIWHRCHSLWTSNARYRIHSHVHQVLPQWMQFDWMVCNWHFFYFCRLYIFGCMNVNALYISSWTKQHLLASWKNMCILDVQWVKIDGKSEFLVGIVNSMKCFLLNLYYWIAFYEFCSCNRECSIVWLTLLDAIVPLSDLSLLKTFDLSFGVCALVVTFSI